jgi:hypothetical protein
LMTAVAYSTFRGWRLSPLGFSRWSEFISGRAMSEGGRGAHTRAWRGQGWGHATLWCGRLLAGLRLPFGLRLHVSKIGTLAFVSSNSKNILCIIFLKYKNSKKQELALWHLDNRLVPENA